MKICYVATTTHISAAMNEGIGASTHTMGLAEELQRHGNEVCIVSEGFAGEPEIENVHGINIYRLKRGVIADSAHVKKSAVRGIAKYLKVLPNTLLALRVAQIVKQEGCDIILERAQSLGVGGIASLLTDRPLAVEVIDNLQSSLSLWRAGKIFAYTDVFFSENVKDKVSLVGSGFNTAIFRPAETRKEFDICYCGSFKEWDGIEDLVEAIELLKNKNKKKRDGKTPKVLMIGKGARFANVREMVNKKGMGENFTFTGNVPLKTVPALINSASLCVAPFNVRGYMKGEFGRYGYYFAPLKVLEYMACGKPVVATNYEIIAGVLQKKEQLFAEGNAAELARKLEALLADKKLQGELGSYNLQESKKHTWGKVAEHMNSEMEALI